MRENAPDSMRRLAMRLPVSPVAPKTKQERAEPAGLVLMKTSERNLRRGTSNFEVSAVAAVSVGSDISRFTGISKL